MFQEPRNLLDLAIEMALFKVKEAKYFHDTDYRNLQNKLRLMPHCTQYLP